MTLSADALERAGLVYGWIAKVNDWLASGSSEDEVKARAIIGQLAQVTAGEVPVINGIIAAQRQAAEAFNLPQRSMRVLCAIGVPQPHPHPANAHAAPPEHPTPSVA